MKNSVESLAKVHVNSIRCSAFIHKSSDFMTDIGWPGFPFGKSMPTSPSHLLLHVTKSVFQEELIHGFPRKRSEEVEWPVVSQTFLRRSSRYTQNVLQQRKKLYFFHLIWLPQLHLLSVEPENLFCSKSMYTKVILNKSRERFLYHKFPH